MFRQERGEALRDIVEEEKEKCGATDVWRKQTICSVANYTSTHNQTRQTVSSSLNLAPYVQCLSDFTYTFLWTYLRYFRRHSTLMLLFSILSSILYCFINCRKAFRGIHESVNDNLVERRIISTMLWEKTQHMLVTAASVWWSVAFLSYLVSFRWKMKMSFFPTFDHQNCGLNICDRHGVGLCAVQQISVLVNCVIFSSPQLCLRAGAQSMLIVSCNERGRWKQRASICGDRWAPDRFDLSNMYSISSPTTREPATKVSAQRQGAPWEMSLSKCVPASHFCGISAASEGSDWH